MKTLSLSAKALLSFLNKKKIATIDELKSILSTRSRMTVFRHLKLLGYITSYSHRGRFYSLKRIAKFNELGLWFFRSAKFSILDTLRKTIEYIIDLSDRGYCAVELEHILKIKVDDALLELIKNKIVVREKVDGVYIYFARNPGLRKQQVLFRKDSTQNLANIKMDPDILLNELKAALVMFVSMLNEKQRRIYAGYESLKIGRGGDKEIAMLLDLNVKTVARGRREILSNKIEFDTIRRTGGGRKGTKKNSQKSSKE